MNFEKLLNKPTKLTYYIYLWTLWPNLVLSQVDETLFLQYFNIKLQSYSAASAFCHKSTRTEGS